MKKDTVDITRELEYHLSTLVHHSADLERQLSLLKRAFRIYAGSVALDEDGNQKIRLTQRDADFIKSVCDELKVFGV